MALDALKRGPTYNLPAGALNKPNTGKKMYFSGITIFTINEGKILNEILLRRFE